MKTLVLSRNIPKKSGHGVQMRLAKHIENLMLQGDVTLLVLDVESEAHDYPNVKTFYSGITKPKPCDDFSILADPENAIALTNEELDFVKQGVANSAVDLFFCFRLVCGRVLEHKEVASLLCNVPKILDIDDIESRTMFRSVQAEYKVFGRLYSLKRLMDSGKLHFLQLRAFKNFDYVFVCSKGDQTLLQKKHGRLCSFVVVPNVVSGTEPLPMAEASDVINLLFVGTLSYHPNARAVHYFMDEIFDQIKACTDKKLHLYIVGHNPTKAIQAYGNRDDVTVTGCVDSLVPYYEMSDIVICPIRSGGGTRIKIIEAMSYNRPVVSTTIGVEGIEITNDVNALIGDNPQGFASQILKLIDSAPLRSTVSQAGFELFQQEYSMKKLNKIYHDIFKDLAPSE